MPNLENDETLLSTLKDYSEQTREWYRERLFVYVPERIDRKGRLKKPDAALSTLVQVVESTAVNRDSRVFAPMTHFITRFTRDGGEDHTAKRISNTIARYARDIGLAFRPSILETRVSTNKHAGFFTGTALFVPVSKDTEPMGQLSVYIYGPEEQNGPREISEWRVTFDDDATQKPAGMYLGQDRFVFGVSSMLPVGLSYVGLKSSPNDARDSGNGRSSAAKNIRSLFNENALIMLLPIGGYGRGGGASLMYAHLCIPARDAMSAEQAPASGTSSNKSNGKQSFWRNLFKKSSGSAPKSQSEDGARSEQPVYNDRPLSLLAGQSSDGIVPPAIKIDPANGILDADITSGLLTKSAADRGYRSVLRVVPNSAYSRLRCVPDTLRGPRLQILGLVVPTPSREARASEVHVGFGVNYQLLPDMLSAQGLAIGLRQGLLGRDFVIWADQNGMAHAETDPLSDQELTRAGAVAMHLISPNARFQPLIDHDANGNIRTIEGLQRLPDNRFAILSRADPEKDLGWIGIPLPHEAGPNEEFPDAPVVMDRINDPTTRSSVCLDWLDNCVKLVLSPSSESPQQSGYARFWTEQLSGMVENLTTHSSFRMVKTEDENGNSIKRLCLVETVKGREQSRELSNGTFIRIGPLIARYHSGDEESA